MELEKVERNIGGDVAHADFVLIGKDADESRASAHGTSDGSGKDNVDAARRRGNEVQAEHVGTGSDGQFRIDGARDAANFDVKRIALRGHSMPRSSLTLAIT